MLLTITTTLRPATDLGYLLHKHPGRLQTVDIACGQAHVFYPEATAERCTAALLLDVDPIGLVRGRRGVEGHDGLLSRYVNDRPFVASSFLAVALLRAFGTTLTGRSKERQELADTAIPLEVGIASLPCRGGERMLRSLFEPLGYSVSASSRLLDETMSEWGPSLYLDVRLQHTCRIADLLGHLYVLLPVLDDDKHYWVGDDEVDKLLRHAGDWLAAHPQRDLIARRYLRHQAYLAREALRRLADEQDPDAAEPERAAEEAAIEQPLRLNERRMQQVVEVLAASGVSSVVDLGCGEGRLLALLLDDRRFARITGVDVSSVALQRATDRLHLDRLPPLKRQRIQLLHGSFTYRDRRLQGHDAATAIEVIEHLEPHRLDAFTHNLLACVQAPVTIVTTPNAEYNARLPGLPAGRFRHRDHRFEWTRAEFSAWADAAARRHERSVTFHPVGDEDPELGAPTQMAVFRTAGGAA